MRTVFFSIAFFAVFLAGCRDKVQNIEISRTQAADKTAEWEVQSDHAVFSSADTETDKSCQLLNAEIQALVTELQDSLKTEAEELFKRLKDEDIDRPQWIYSLFVTDSVFMASGKYISVCLKVHSFTGGAHGRTVSYAFNYDVKNSKMLEPSEIIDYSQAESVNRLLKTHFKNPEGCFSSDPTLDLAATINFTEKDVCFTYAHYDLGPYACGIAEVTVPRMELGKAFLVR